MTRLSNGSAGSRSRNSLIYFWKAVTTARPGRPDPYRSLFDFRTRPKCAIKGPEMKLDVDHLRVNICFRRGLSLNPVQ